MRQPFFSWRRSPWRSHASALALTFATLTAAVTGVSLAATTAPASAALSSGCTDFNGFVPGIYGGKALFGRTFLAGERITITASAPFNNGSPTSISFTGTDPAGHAINLSTSFPGTLTYDFPLSGVYPAIRWQVVGGNVTWQGSCGPVPPPLCGDRCNDGGTPPKPAPARIIVCGPRGDGRSFAALNIQYSQWTDPNSPDYNVPLARYAAAAGGATCDMLPGFSPTGQFTDGFGTFVAKQNTKLGDGIFAPYPVWAPAKA
jgi:hypothetical protein